MFALRQYQLPHALSLATSLGRLNSALDASDTGTGKTYVALWLAQSLRVVPLVICPKSVVADWQRAAELVGIEIEVINYEKLKGVRRPVLMPPPRCPTNGLQLQGPYYVSLARTEWGCESPKGSGSIWTWALAYELIIFDEVDRCGGSTSLNSKLLIAARRQASKVLCLSATAADNPLQLKALAYTLGLINSPSEFFQWALRNGCKRAYHGGLEFTKDSAKQKLAMAKIHHAIFSLGRGARMRKADIPGFPKTVVDVKLVQDETGRAKQLAEELAEAYLECTALEYMTALRQKLELLKVPHLVEFTEHYARTSKVVVFVNYTATIEALQKAYRKIFAGPVPVINGENTGAERDSIKLRFQANEEPVVICNIQAGGIGIGLHDPTGKVERTTLISPTYSARQLKQVLGRTPRDGGAFSQQFFVYFADTLEADVAAAVRGKLENLDALNDAVLHGVVPINVSIPNASSESSAHPHQPGHSLQPLRREEAPGHAQHLSGRCP